MTTISLGLTVARDAQSPAVTKIKSKIRKITEWLDVVRMKIAATLAAFLAGKFVSLENSHAPFFDLSAISNAPYFWRDPAFPIAPVGASHHCARKLASIWNAALAQHLRSRMDGGSRSCFWLVSFNLLSARIASPKPIKKTIISLEIDTRADVACDLSNPVFHVKNILQIPSKANWRIGANDNLPAHLMRKFA